MQKDANVKGCFHPDTKECDQKIIRAHSLQNNKIINQLSIDGQVYMIRTEYTKDGHGLSLSKVGRASATTFTGFCKKHDKEVFAPIEDSDYTDGDRRQEALFAFRALTKEWHAKLVAYNSVTDRRIAEIKNPDIEAFRYGLSLGLNDLATEAQTFKTMLLNEDYNKICTKILKFAGEPTVAVSSGITISHDFNGDPLPHFEEHNWVDPNQLFLTVFPQNGETICLMSYACAGEETFTFIDEQIINQPDNIQRERMSKLIITHCENTIFSPTFIETMDEEKRKVLEDEYSRSVTLYAPENLLTEGVSIPLFD